MNVDRINKALESKIKHVFKTCLKGIEIRFGDQFDGYEQLRSEILRVGNNAIRELKEVLSDECGEDFTESETKVRMNIRSKHEKNI